jgi:hypothetical protein
LAGLFVEAFGAAKGWTEPKVARFERLDDVEQEPVFTRLKAEGHTLSWARETRLRQLKREGWTPVFERDAILWIATKNWCWFIALPRRMAETQSAAKVRITSALSLPNLEGD